MKNLHTHVKTSKKNKKTYLLNFLILKGIIKKNWNMISKKKHPILMKTLKKTQKIKINV